MSYYCGWDGGGSKTEVLCRDAAGHELGRMAFGPLNINGAPRERVAQTIADSVAFMASMPCGLDGCKKLVIGTAGVSNTEVFSFLSEHVREAGYVGEMLIVGDQDIALAGAVDGAGAVLIAGTGAICCGINAQGNRTRVGGFGHLIDDGGSGYAIGRDILTAVVRAHDGRGPKTMMTEAVFAKLGVSEIRGVITWLYSSATGKKEVAALAPILLDALAQDDLAAQKIVLRAAEELSALAIAAWKNLELDAGELALTGSVLTHYAAIREQVRANCEAVFPRMRVISPHGSASEGAVKLAMQP